MNRCFYQMHLGDLGRLAVGIVGTSNGSGRIARENDGPEEGIAVVENLVVI